MIGTDDNGCAAEVVDSEDAEVWSFSVVDVSDLEDA
jgi:hypothetical protein